MMNYKTVSKKITDFIRKKNNNLNGTVIGLSGGLDSTVVAYLAVKALGKNKVTGLILPYKENKETEEGIKIAKILGIKYYIINIQPIFESFEGAGFFIDKMTRGNLMARIRMCLLYGFANRNNMFVLGTSNKSEIQIGYFTKYGDGGADIEPIGDLYKTEVWELAKYLDIPEEIINKKPSAGLWDGQTDENEIGISYVIIDKILKGKISGIDKDKIKVIKERYKNSEHKRKMPPIAKVRE